ncbi:MAG: hypothetical protein K6F57_00955 [Candidatus Saccharibacteria bacterium]|nr:hypothetical protein [Candidatus Saccharibacteria bacterium]
MTKWGDMKPESGDATLEYWTDASIQERPLDQQYPRLEQEGQEEYEARLKDIAKKIMGAYKAKTYPSNGKQYYLDYETTEPDGKGGERVVYHGHSFEELEPDIEDLSRQKYYEEVFGMTKAERTVETLGKALRQSEEARSNPDKYPLKVASPKIYESQTSFARHYIGGLNYKERPFVDKGIFSGYGESRYSEKDALHLANVKAHIFEDERNKEYLALATTAKMFEGTFYPFVLQGFFDYRSENPKIDKHASIIVPSEFDDVCGKVDAAVMLPIAFKTKEGEIKTKWFPICFDLTTGTGNGKVGKISDNFGKKHGYADMKYPSSCEGKPVEPLNDVPHFALTMESTAFRRFIESVAGGRALSSDLMYMINYQIQQQAIVAQEYWGKRPDEKKKADEMAILANHFGERAKANAATLSRHGGSVANVRRTYHNSFRYLKEL